MISKGRKMCLVEGEIEAGNRDDRERDSITVIFRAYMSQNKTKETVFQAKNCAEVSYLDVTCPI